MRTAELSGGSLKALLIFLLVAANIIAALPRDGAQARQAQIRNAVHVQRVPSEKHPH